MNLRYRTQAPSIGLSQAVHPPSATASESQAMTAKTLYDKLWEMHEVTRRDDGSSLIYIDRHILHEVTSPQAFEGLRLAGRKPCLLYTSPSPRDVEESRMPSSA